MSQDIKRSIREVFSGDEISIYEIFLLFKDRVKYIYISVGVFFVLGILVILTSPYEYESESRILSETKSTKASKGLRSLGGILGLGQSAFGGDGSESGLNAELYPEIIASQPFLLDLIQEEFYFEELGQKITLEEYFSRDQKRHILSTSFRFIVSLPNRFFNLFGSKKKWESQPPNGSSSDTLQSAPVEEKFSIIPITSKQSNIIKMMKDRMVIEAADRIISLRVTMPEPKVSAEFNVVVLKKIIQYVASYETEKQRDNLKFIEERHFEAMEKFKEAQLALANFMDSNVGIVSAVAKSRQQQLQAEFNLAFDIYRGLAQQLEEAKIKLKQETPVFTEFDPVIVPFGYSEPNIPVILALFTALGIVFGGIFSVVVIIRDYRREFRK